jgi:F-type H+-transporting ATPase subunit delta
VKKARQKEREARKLLRFCIVGGTLDSARARIVAEKLLQTKRRGYLSLLKRFVHLMKQEYARHFAEIESAVPMADDLRSLVLDRLIAAYGPAVTSSFVHNPGLIGGMRIKIGSDVYDGSVRSALTRLASNLGIPATNLSGGPG